MGRNVPDDKHAAASGGIDTEMYLRDGAPHATVCKVQMKDGRIGIGLTRSVAGAFPMSQASYDALALSNALANLHERPQPAGDPPAETPEEPDHDLQASLGQKAHD